MTDLLLRHPQMAALFQQALQESGRPPADADLLTTGYTAMIDGLWLDLLVIPRQLSRKRAQQIAQRYVTSALPELFQR